MLNREITEFLLRLYYLLMAYKWDCLAGKALRYNRYSEYEHCIQRANDFRMEAKTHE